MLPRALMSVILVLVAGTQSRAENHATAKVGDQIVLNMTGKLAVEYARQTGSRPEVLALDGLSIETTAIVVRELGGGRLRIEHTSQIVRDGDSMRLVTLTAIVDSSNISTDVTPTGTAVYASPGAYKRKAAPKLTAEETRSLRLRLSDLKDLKLRAWNLAEEIGD